MPFHTAIMYIRLLKKLISISESSLEDMFEVTKKEFLQGNGMGNGDTTRRSDVYTDLYRKMGKKDRLAAGYTLSQYEKAYTQAFIAAAKAAYFHRSNRCTIRCTSRCN